MASEENARKKRTSERELTKDNYADEDEQGDSTDPGAGFQKASNDILARRKIVKARRPGGGGTAGLPLPKVPVTSASPFAGGFSLVAPNHPEGGGQSLPKVASSNPLTASGTGFTSGGFSLAAAKRQEKEAAPTPVAENVDRPPSPEPEPDIPGAPPQAAEAGVIEADDSDGESDEVTSSAKKPEKEDGGESKEGAVLEEAKVDGKEDQAPALEDGGSGEKAPSPAAAEPKHAGFAGLSSAPNAFAAGSFGGTTGFGGAATSPFGAFGASTAFPSITSIFGSGSAGGSSLFGASAAFGAAPKVSAENGGEGENEEGGLPIGGFGGAAATPVVTLTEVAVETGEEGEEVAFEAGATLYEFAEGGKWKERGKGELRLNVLKGKEEKDKSRGRLVMRARGNLRLLLNAYLYKGMKLSRMDGGRGASFSCVNSAADADKPGAEKTKDLTDKGDDKSKEEGYAAAGQGPQMGTYAVRFKEGDALEQFLKAVEENKEEGEETVEGEEVV